MRVGDHIAYFWETPKEFEQGVNFLVAGLAERDHCVIFGHDEANQRVCRILESRQISASAAQREGRLTVVGAGSTGDDTLAKLGTVFGQALAQGAPLIRLLGNIGWGQPDWPDEEDLLLFEAKVTGAAKQFPAVIVCMYDVATLSGRAIINGGLATHPITVCGNVMRVNPHYVELDAFTKRVRDTAPKPEDV